MTRAPAITVEPAVDQGRLRGLTAAMTTCVLLLAFTLFVRAASLGNPDYHPDETFYLLVGNAMHHGAVPYIDIWDRKPPGLFVFYWLLAAISPTVFSFQIAAMGFVTATAWCVVRIAGRWSNQVGAHLAGVIYIAWLQPLLGGGGQAPVFYNLFVAGAFLLLVRRTERAELSSNNTSSTNAAEAIIAGLLCGIAVSFKPTAVFEGGFIVLAFVAAEWRSAANWRKPAFLFGVIGIAAALPTLACAGWYFVHGHFYTYFHATVLSNFEKTRAAPFVFWTTVRYLVALTFLLVAGAALGLGKALEAGKNVRFNRLVLGWLVAALIGFFAVPNFYSHYALPLLPVLAVCSAPYFAKPPLGVVLAMLSLGWALCLGQSFQFSRMQQSRVQFERVVAVVRANMPNSSLYVYDGSPWLYAATHARLPTRFVFPEHLMLRTEAGAIGVDPSTEMAAVLRGQPDVIVLAASLRPDANPKAFYMLRNAVRQHYTFVCSLPGRRFEQSYRTLIFAKSRTPDRSACPLQGHSPAVPSAAL